MSRAAAWTTLAGPYPRPHSPSGPFRTPNVPIHALIALVCLSRDAHDSARDEPRAAAASAATQETLAALRTELFELLQSLRGDGLAYRRLISPKLQSGEALSAEERAQDPALVYGAKFRDFEARARGTYAGGTALLVALELCAARSFQAAPVEPREIDALRAEAAALADAIVAGYANAPEETFAEDEQPLDHPAAGLCGRLYQGLVPGLLGGEKTEALFKAIVERATLPEVRAVALYFHGTALMETADDHPDAAARKAEGLAMLKKLIAQHPEHMLAKAAGGMLFEKERLQVGMSVPDFEASDEAGVKFKLSEYRGKVVMLDFWGFW